MDKEVNVKSMRVGKKIPKHFILLKHSETVEGRVLSLNITDDPQQQITSVSHPSSQCAFGHV